MSKPIEQPDSAYVLRNFIAGEWQEPGSTPGQQVCNANTGEAMLQQYDSTPAQINAAIAAAQERIPGSSWQCLSNDARADKLLEIADALEPMVMDIALVDAMMTGVPLKHTRTISALCPAAFRVAADLARKDGVIRKDGVHLVERIPLGVAAIIGPWNAPSGIACHKLASALAAGCPVVFKPSEWAPYSGQMIAEAIAALDVPPGMFQLVHGAGDTGAAIVSDERIAAVSFTGGLKAGRAVGEACARQVKPAQLELGGNNPFVILEGADTEAAVDGILFGLTTLNGQWCRAVGRIIVHESLRDEVVSMTLDRLSKLRVGDSTDIETDLGPLAHRGHLAHVQSAISRYRMQGGNILQGTPMPPLPGWFVPPTLITGIDSSQALDEIFGPVATVHDYSTVDEAIAMANEAPYGLAAYVFGDRDHAFDMARHIEAGMIKVNSVTLFSPHPSAPRPAWKMSGIGDEGTEETFEFFRGSRVIGVAQGMPA